MFRRIRPPILSPLSPRGSLLSVTSRPNLKSPLPVYLPAQLELRVFAAEKLLNIRISNYQ